MHNLKLISIMILVLAVSGVGACGEEVQPPGQEGDGDADGDSEGTGETGDDECVGDQGCFSCEPATSVELLNACTDAGCQPFQNTPERLPLLEPDGSLPPLP